MTLEAGQSRTTQRLEARIQRTDSASARRDPEPRARSQTRTVERRTPVYLISTFAPASSNFFLMAAASSLVTPSLIGFGARLDEVLGFLQAEARDFADDLDHVDLVAADVGQRHRELGLLFAAAAAAAAAAAIGIAIGIAAAADTPSSDSSALTSCDSSSTEIPLM